MKTLFTFAALFLAIQLNYAQTEKVSYQLAGNVKTSSAKTITKDHNYSFEHSRSAFKQIREHILENIKYPEILQQQGIEGTVVIEVSLSISGQIETSSILKSPSPLFNDAVLKAVTSLKSIRITENKYEGNKKLHVPIQFSLQ